MARYAERVQDPHWVSLLRVYLHCVGRLMRSHRYKRWRVSATADTSCANMAAFPSSLVREPWIPATSPRIGGETGHSFVAPTTVGGFGLAFSCRRRDDLESGTDRRITADEILPFSFERLEQVELALALLCWKARDHRNSLIEAVELSLIEIKQRVHSTLPLMNRGLGRGRFRRAQYLGEDGVQLSAAHRLRQDGHTQVVSRHIAHATKDNDGRVGAHAVGSQPFHDLACRYVAQLVAENDQIGVSLAGVGDNGCAPFGSIGDGKADAPKRLAAKRARRRIRDRHQCQRRRCIAVMQGGHNSLR